MAQLALNKGKAAMVRTETVKISGSALSQRIQQFSLTLIGRLMNPSIQRMDSLVANMPKIWKLEDKVVGADLGQGTFQFNFDSEEELEGVLHNVPYHFDGWMIALVRWEPIILSTYPSAINFWVKASGIPIHLWEEATLRAIGKKLGLIREIDEDTGSIYVTVNGFNPIMFQLVVPFDTGDEVVVSLEYEKLIGFCEHCFRLTHEAGACPELRRVSGNRVIDDQADRRGPPRQQLLAKQNAQKHEGGWEKPRKVTAKRALDFHSEDNNGSFQYHVEEGNAGKHNYRRFDKHAAAWGNKRGFPGNWAESSGEFRSGAAGNVGEGSQFQAHSSQVGRRGPGPLWPKPLYQVKQVPNVDNSVINAAYTTEALVVGKIQDDLGSEVEPETESKELSAGLDFIESKDDLLEDGEYQEEDQVMVEEEESTNETHVHVEDNTNGKGMSCSSDSFCIEMGKVSKALKEVDLGSKTVLLQKTYGPHGSKCAKANKRNALLMASPGKRLLAKALLSKNVGDGIKQKAVGRQHHKVKEGIISGGESRVSKKGTVALPKPPAQT